MNIQPIKRPVNYNEYINWVNNHYEERLRYDDFVADMIQNGYSEKKAKEMWLHNFGVIPPIEPERIYQCNILDSSVKIVVTVLRRNNILNGEKKFEVVKLNRLFLDTYDHKRILTIENGKVVFKIIHKELVNNLTTLENTRLEDLPLLDTEEQYAYIEHSKSNGYPLNYEDSNWFTSMAVSDLLSRLKLSIKEYVMPKDGEEPGRPTLYINSMDFMESTEIEITDKEFKKKLYEQIEKSFLRIESELK